MPALVDIFNRAAVILGEARVIAPDENVKAARECNALWETTRQALLREHRWGFSMTRAVLAPLAQAPAFGFGFQFLLPAGFLRLDYIEDVFVGLPHSGLYMARGESLYAVEQYGLMGAEQKVLLCDLANPLNIRFVRDVTNTLMFDALFTESVASKLAYDVGWSLTKNDNACKRVEMAFARSIRMAKSVNAIERPPEQLGDGTWLASRQ